MKKYLTILASVFLLVFSSATQKRKPKRFKILPKSFVEIPAGYLYDSLHVGEAIIVRNYTPKKDSTKKFYISQTEITNGEYRLFLNSLKKNNNEETYLNSLPDTMVWYDVFTGESGAAFMKYYFRHRAYNNYPIVGVSKVQALAYCKWLSDSFNSANPDLHVEFNLPTRNQWIRSARGDSSNQIYSMNWPKLQNTKGYYLYNHKVIEGQHIYRDTKTKKLLVAPLWVMESSSQRDNGWSLVETKSYYPNDFGMYNLCGNVAEMILDDTIALGGSWNDPGFDIRIESAKPATKPSSMIGFRVVANIKGTSKL